MGDFAHAELVIIDTDGDSFISDMTGTTPPDAGEYAIMHAEAVAAGYSYSAWWSYTALHSGELTVTFINSIVTEPMAAGGNVYTGGPALAGIVVQGSTLPSTVFHYDVTAGQTYYIQGATRYAEDTLKPIFTGPATPEFGPVVVLDPISRTVTEGTRTVFKSLGAGRPRPTVQWQRKAPEG